VILGDSIVYRFGVKKFGVYHVPEHYDGPFVPGVRVFYGGRVVGHGGNRAIEVINGDDPLAYFGHRFTGDGKPGDK
jgi:hypothetical protein